MSDNEPGPYEPMPMAPLPPVSAGPPPSAFLWTGLACLALALLLGVGVVYLSMTASNAGTQADTVITPAQAMMIASALLMTGMILVIAQTRYVFWRRAAGIVALVSGERDVETGLAARDRLSHRYDGMLLAALAILAAMPRLAALRHSLSYNELRTLEFVQNGPVYALTHQEGFNNHLLNSLLASLPYSLYATATGGDIPLPPAWLARLPAFLFGIAAVPLLFVTARRVMERPPAIAAAVLLALSPVAIDMSALSRGYALMIFFAIAQAYWLSVALRASAAGAWVWWLLCAFLGTLAHPFFWLIVAANLVYILALAVWTRNSMLDGARAASLVEQGITLSAAWAATAFGGYICVFPVMRQIYGNYAKAGTARALPEMIAPLLQLWGGLPPESLLLPYYLACALLLLFGVWYLARVPTGAAVYLPLTLAVSFLLVTLWRPPVLEIRYFAFLLPAFLALLACGMWRLVVWVLGEQSQRVIYHRLGISVLTLLFVALSLHGILETLRSPRQDYDAMMLKLADELRAGHVAVGVGRESECVRRYIQDYFKGQPIPPNQAQAFGSGVQSEEQVRSLARAFKTVFVVHSERPIKPPARPSKLVSYLQSEDKKPFVIAGRYAKWPQRGLANSRDIYLYRVAAGR